MLTELITVVVLICIVYFLIKMYIDGNDDYWPKNGVRYLDLNTIAPAYKRLTLQLSFIELDKKYYEYFKNDDYGGFMQFRTPVFYVKNLDMAKQILVKDFDHFTNRRVLEVPNEPTVSRMLLAIQASEWKDLRSIMSPTFSTGKIHRMFQFFNDSAHRLSDYLKRHLNQNGGREGTIDFVDCFGRYTMDVISSAAFGVQTDTFAAEESLFQTMAKKMNKITPARFMAIFTWILVPPVARVLGLKINEPTSMKFFTSIVEKSIEERRKNFNEKGEKRNDFLQLLLEAQEGQLKADDHEVLDQDEAITTTTSSENSATAPKKDVKTILDATTIMAQCLQFFSAGSDTIESLLTFATYAIAVHPEIQDKLAQEVDQVFEDNGENLTYELTHGMQYLDMVVSETLRLYPPVFATERCCTKDYNVPGTKIVIRKGTYAFFPVNSYHHDEKYYSEPYRFNPDNFSAENKAKRHPYAFMPFGQGPRNCIAMRFALTEAKAALAHLVHNFRLEPTEKTDIPMKFVKQSFVLKPENGLFLKFTPR